jgi:hypothetical protein
MFAAQLLVFDAVHHCESLVAIDGLGRQFDELLRITREIVELKAVRDKAANGLSGQSHSNSFANLAMKKLNISVCCPCPLAKVLANPSPMEIV